MFVLRQVLFVGRGLSINLPVSSQDILKSPNTSLVLDVIIEAAITRLWTPSNKMITVTKKLYCSSQIRIKSIKIICKLLLKIKYTVNTCTIVLIR